MYEVEPRYKESLYNEVPAVTNDILWPDQSHSKMYGTETRYNEPRYRSPNLKLMYPDITKR